MLSLWAFQGLYEAIRSVPDMLPPLGTGGQGSRGKKIKLVNEMTGVCI